LEDIKPVETDSNIEALDMCTEIVSAYVSNNAISQTDLPKLIVEIHNTIRGLSTADAQPAAEARKPAVSIKKSITPDYIICLEDGKKFKSLKRHLRTHYDLSPEAYREKWNLPADYPMVAPNYAAARSRLAREMGLGRKAAK